MNILQPWLNALYVTLLLIFLGWLVILGWTRRTPAVHHVPPCLEVAVCRARMQQH